MKDRVSGIAVLAVVLWGSVALHTSIQAQGGQAGKSLTDQSLKELLDGLGYEPKKLTTGYLVSIQKDGWTYHTQFVLSKDKTRIGMNANLGNVDLDGTSATQWRDLLIANGNIDPSFFYVDKDTKKLYIHRVLDNREITPAYIRQQTENFCANIKDTNEAWKFVK